MDQDTDEYQILEQIAAELDVADQRSAAQPTAPATTTTAAPTAGPAASLATTLAANPTTAPAAGLKKADSNNGRRSGRNTFPKEYNLGRLSAQSIHVS